MSVERSAVTGLGRPDHVGPIGRAWAWLNQYALLPTILGTFLALVLLATIMTLSAEQFLTPRNIRNIFTQASVYVVLGVGMTFVLNTGGIDISMGSALGLATSAWAR